MKNNFDFLENLENYLCKKLYKIKIYKLTMKPHITFLVLVAVAINSNNAQEANNETDIGVVIGIDLGTTYSW